MTASLLFLANGSGGDKVGGGPVGGLGVFVEGDGDGGSDGIHGDVIAVDEDRWVWRTVGGEVFGGGFDGDLAGLAGDEGDVVVGVEDGEDAGVLLIPCHCLAMELEVGHEGDGFGGVAECDGEHGVLAFGAGGRGDIKRCGGQGGETGEVVLGYVLPVEVGREELAGGVGEVELDEVEGLASLGMRRVVTYSSMVSKSTKNWCR
jgi:hypothetical protein